MSLTGLLWWSGADWTRLSDLKPYTRSRPSRWKLQRNSVSCRMHVCADVQSCCLPGFQLSAPGNRGSCHGCLVPSYIPGPVQIQQMVFLMDWSRYFPAVCFFSLLLGKFQTYAKIETLISFHVWDTKLQYLTVHDQSVLLHSPPSVHPVLFWRKSLAPDHFIHRYCWNTYL